MTADLTQLEALLARLNEIFHGRLQRWRKSSD